MAQDRLTTRSLLQVSFVERCIPQTFGIVLGESSLAMAANI